MDDNCVLPAYRHEVTHGGHCLLWGCLWWLAGGHLLTQWGGCWGWWTPWYALPLTSMSWESTKGTILPIPQLTSLGPAMRMAAPVRVAVGRVRAFLYRTWAARAPALLICILIICVLPVSLMYGLIFQSLLMRDLCWRSLPTPPSASLCSSNQSSLLAPSSGTCGTRLHSTSADISSTYERSLVVPHMGIHSVYLVSGL